MEWEPQWKGPQMGMCWECVLPPPTPIQNFQLSSTFFFKNVEFCHPPHLWKFHCHPVFLHHPSSPLRKLSLARPQYLHPTMNFSETYIWMTEIMLPNKPIMPRNSTLLKVLTTNSCATLETPYIMAPHKTRTSPIA